jgi:mRNA-degrading endonuclease RelE of RelBE toxin-antitoxin system
MPNSTLSIAPRARKALRRAQGDDRARLLAALDSLAEDPSAGDVAPLRHERSAFRRRVGDWRIFFDLSPRERVVNVVAIERRTTTTYRRRPYRPH